MSYEAVIGLEVHAQLKTNSKIFCGCSTNFGSGENTNICPVCTGQPGVLPVLNRKAVEYLVKTGVAVGCRINHHSVFARKQYFYPDLPKNYQISQYELPLAEHGYIDISIQDTPKRIGITRIHLEEDAGKLLHAIGNRELDHSLVDLNRTGIPLMEIVSDPDMRSPEEAYQYLVALKSIIEYLDVSDCDMEEGKFRCDANVSVRPVGQKELGTKAEVKNMNTLKGVREALEYEIKRQIEAVSAGEKIVQETRLWNAGERKTYPMRSKEEAHDYRYFPEPDLVPMELSKEFIDTVCSDMPELPVARRERFKQQWELSDYDAGVLTADKALADYFERALSFAGGLREVAKPLANWATTELQGRLNAQSITVAESPVSPQRLAELVTLIHKGTISGRMAKTVFDEMFVAGKAPADIVAEKGLLQINDESALEAFCKEAIAENPKAIAEIKAGKEKAIGALVGAVMKKTGGKANPGAVNTLLKKLIV